ncbi:MAG: hypothetical protein JO047_08550 [Alphaproteobacteria bacterium]|nr:hypothetical protein [Alphaproteobacteria bacterium]
MLAIAATILALLYPPWQRHGAPGAVSRYVPLTPRSALGPPYVDVLSFAGRWIPLPAGEWRGVNETRTKSDPPQVSTMFVRMNGNTTGGILVVDANSAPSTVPRAFPLPHACNSPLAYAARMIPPHDQVQHECWSILPAFLPADWSSPKVSATYRRGMQRLQEANIAVPPVLIGATWFECDDRNWLLVQYFFDPTTDASVPKDPLSWVRSAALGNADASRYIDRVKAWSSSWTTLLEKGAHAELLPSEVNAASSMVGN